MNNIKVKIERLKNPTQDDVKDINILLPQQARLPRFLNLKELKRVTGQDFFHLYVARAKIGNRSSIVGMGSVIFYWVPTGLISFIEELTVDEHFRGLKIGLRLVQKLVDDAKKKKAKHITTYTNFDRLAANGVYQRLNFFKKEANLYRMNIFLPKPSSKRAVNEIIRLQKKRAALL